MFKPTLGAQYRLIDPDNTGFGIGKATHTVMGVVTLVNRSGEQTTTPASMVIPVPGMLADVIQSGVAAIKHHIEELNTWNKLPYVRTFADLHEHMDASALLHNHVPELFPRTTNDLPDDRQIDVESRVSEMVNEWLIERWDNDPYNQPAPDTDEKVASILAAMLDMSLEEQQWGNADKVEVLDGFGPDQVRLRVADHIFTIRVTRED
jgi:hypothetical protein